jgi:hypothetical protein
MACSRRREEEIRRRIKAEGRTGKSSCGSVMAV